MVTKIKVSFILILSVNLHLFFKTRAENEELREDLSEVTAQHNSVLEENQRLRAKLENLEQVLKVQSWPDTHYFQCHSLPCKNCHLIFFF